jgi:hypothetical protein
MHTICCDCGLPIGGCLVDAAAQEPTELDVALADHLRQLALAVEDGWDDNHPPVVSAWNLARVINGDQ